MFLSGILMVGFPYLVRTVLGLSAEHYGAAESAMGIAAIAGSIAIGVAAGKLRTRYMTVLISASGICLFPAGLIFITSASPFVKYLVLLLAFCCCQFICSMFSVYALSLIQQRTPEHLTGKVMSYVYTISLCAQPVGQMIYGVLFDVFSDSICLVLIPSGILICTAGIMSSGFFRRLETF